MHHLALFAETLTLTADYKNVAAVNDGVLFSEGDDIRVDDDYSYLRGAMVLNAADQQYVARLTSPTLRLIGDESILAAPYDDDPDNIDTLYYPPESPLKLGGNESIRLQALSLASAPTASLIVGALLLGTGATAEVTGQFRTVEFTSTSIAPAAVAWSNRQITFSQELPNGRYRVLGCLVLGTAGLTAFRLLFPAQSMRPGWFCQNNLGTTYPQNLMSGRFGVWGEFSINQPPTLDVFSANATAVAVRGFMQLQKVG